MVQNRHRVLVISPNNQLRCDLVTLLSGYGYFVEEKASRGEGLKSYRDHKQSIVIIDRPILRDYSKKMFKFIQKVQKNAIILVTAEDQEKENSLKHLSQGAYDILGLPLKKDILIHTLARAKDHHRMLLENIFVKNILFFAILLLPLWVFCLYLILK